MVRHILILYIHIKILPLRTLLNEVVTIERINEKFTIEVKIQRKQYSKHMLDLCVFVKNHSNKRTLASKKSTRALRTNNSSLSESYRSRPPAPPSLAVRLQAHLSRKWNPPYMHIYIPFTCGLKSKKSWVKSYLRLAQLAHRKPMTSGYVEAWI